MKRRPHYLRQVNGGQKIDTEQCCTGMCSQGRECPRYRQPAAPTDSRATVDAWVTIVVVAVLALILLVAPRIVGAIVVGLLAIGCVGAALLAVAAWGHKGGNE